MSTARELTRTWGPYAAVRLYLHRCQVATPADVVTKLWELARARRTTIDKVVEFGAGDGRFAVSSAARFTKYTGYEIDLQRWSLNPLPRNARIVAECAFAQRASIAQLCVGNPPYVRNQALPQGWREEACRVIRERTGVVLSGLANAWQYFMFLALSATRPDGLVALVVPFEWVSRPSAKALREYVSANGWSVDVYRLRDDTFGGVLTTSSITVIDKLGRSGWRYFSENADGTFSELSTPSGGAHGQVAHCPDVRKTTDSLRVHRGLSPGTQKVLTLTEPERARNGLRIGSDVVPCVTSLRPLPPDLSLTDAAFRKYYQEIGHKCWLIRTDKAPSARLRAYLNAIPKDQRATATCNARVEWWKFVMPEVPRVLVASAFTGPSPKVATNNAGAVAVGGVYGIHGVSSKQSTALIRFLRAADFNDKVVAHSNGLMKFEPGQMLSIAKAALKETHDHR